MNNLYTLDQICKKITDGSHQSPKEDPTGYPMVSVKDMTEFGFDLSKVKHISKNDFEKLVKQGCKPEVDDILIAKDGSVMKHIFRVRNADNIVLLSSIAILRPNKEIVYPDFLVYSLKNNGVKEDILNNYVSGSGVPRIVLKDFKKVELDIPNLDLQINISKKLRSLDDKIELNTQINQTLEQIAQALFKSWFVDFDPVRAKVQALSDGLSLEQAELAAMQAISGKTPEKLTALSQAQPDRYAELAETAKAFPCEMVEVDGGEVPKGWEMKALSDLGQIVCGKTPSKSNKEFYGDDVPFIKIPDMHNQVFITQTTDNLSVAGANSQSKKYIPPKSICVSCIATVGLVSMTSKPSHTNQQINSIIPNDEQTSEFLYLSLKQPSMTKYLKDLASGGSATLNLNTSTFSKIEIITPSKEIIDIFHNKVFYTFEKVLSNSIENKRLAKTRDLLLPRLLNGEI